MLIALGGLICLLVGYGIGVSVSENEFKHGALEHMLIIHSTSNRSKTTLDNYHLSKIHDDYTYHMIKFNVRRILELTEEYCDGLLKIEEYNDRCSYHSGIIREM